MPHLAHPRAVPFQTFSSLAQSDSFVLDQYRQKKALTVALNATGGNAADTIRAFPAGVKGETTVDTAALAAATSIILDTTDAAGTEINGNVIGADDFILVKLDTGGWQLLDITTVTPDAGNSRVTLGFNTFDGVTGLSAAVAAGNVAYVIFNEDVGQIDLGTSSLNLENSFVGFTGHPLALSNDGNAAAAHFMSGVAEYVD